MKLFLSRLVFSISTVAITLAFTVISALALENAYRWSTSANQGAYSAIVTGNPTLRDNSTGKWSYMRVFSQRVINGNVYYVEVGWMKGTQPESGGTPRSYWTYRATNGTIDQGWGGYPGIGIGYNYEVKRTGSNTWGFYFNNLSSPLVTRSVGWDTADRYGSGGETPNTSQGMGDSYNNNVSYLSTGGTWIGACNMNQYITNSIYHVDNGSNCSSWRVYGNN